MKNLSHIVTSLHSKVEKLVHLHKKLQEDYESLAKENTDLIKIIEQQKINTNKLEEKNKVIKLAKTLSETNENSLDIKLKINELVREIDKCIALLNR